MLDTYQLLCCGMLPTEKRVQEKCGLSPFPFDAELEKTGGNQVQLSQVTVEEIGSLRPTQLEAGVNAQVHYLSLQCPFHQLAKRPSSHFYTVEIHLK